MAGIFAGVAAHAGRARREEPTAKEGTCRAGLAHEIPVYANGEPMGWCQYGSSEELSRIDTKKNYRELSLWAGTEKLWRITCFGREAPPSRCGSAALEAALESMR